ncbi:hypothetical protein MKZ38_001946 [Zalerion maritima]|uniref:F-box domain-containing protein n=1 Tax=Zalerion maritima TaxID=339359 RepID=A0AAD5RQA3_9PEZI|nr:hypothetical protein MKZ38_001946 [Zalerion maritima]
MEPRATCQPSMRLGFIKRKLVVRQRKLEAPGEEEAHSVTNLCDQGRNGEIGVAEEKHSRKSSGVADDISTLGHAPKPANMDTLPSDIIGNVLGHCHSISDIQNLRQVSRNIDNTYQHQQLHVLRSLLSSHYNPYEELLELVAVLKHGVVSGPHAIYVDTPLNVVYQKTPFSKQVVLSRSRRAAQRRPVSVILTQWDLWLIAHVCRTIDQWIDIFPQVRFRKGPAYIRRCLRSSEEKRSSRALVRWWRYSLQFQGKLGWHLSVPWDSFAGDEDYDAALQHVSGSEDVFRSDQTRQYHDNLAGYNITPGSSYTEATSLSDTSSTTFHSQTSFASEEFLEGLLARNRESLYSGYSEHISTFEPDGPDLSTGRAFMRMLPTMHLIELRDILSSVHDMVAFDICPSYECMVETMEDSFHPKHTSLSWGRQRQNFTIVNTYMKLPPDDLLVLWTMKSSSPYAHEQTRTRVRERALSMLPGLGLTKQTMGSSLDYVLRERSVLDRWDRHMANDVASGLGLQLRSWPCWSPPAARLKYGGILDNAGDAFGGGSPSAIYGSGSWDEEYDAHDERYGGDEVRSGEKPDCGGYSIEDALWSPPLAGWTVTERPVRGRPVPAALKLKGDDGGSILPRVLAEMEDMGFYSGWRLV